MILPRIACLFFCIAVAPAAATGQLRSGTRRRPKFCRPQQSHALARMCFTCLAAFCLALPAQSSAQTASGVFESQPEGRITPKVAAAYVVRDQFNPRQTEVEIILSTTPVDVGKAAADLSPHMAVINDPALKDTNYVLLWISSDGKVSMNATFSKTMTQFVDRASVDGRLRAELTTNTPDKVAGRIFTTGPVKTLSGSTYNVDLTFSAPVAKPPAGVALQAGGGEPGKALMDFFNARLKKDWPSLKVALSPAMTEMFVKSYNDDKENLADMLDTLDFLLPAKDVKITGGELSGNTAVLDVEGVLASGVKVLTLVRLIRGPSGWLFDRATMAGMLP